mmetsp:Transcript_83510/g.190474  ORF Transcript_83510/g.190474 Transcript_83510/m.190474 type:complete len:256 (+) Transcript_83510:446-1213(+)
MASAFTPHRFKSLDRVSHIFFVEEKIITRAPPPWAPCISCSTFAKVLSLSRGLFMTTTFCVISWLALRLSTSPTFSFQGDLINSLARARTSFGHVAVNNKVCRFGGIEEITLRIWGSNPMSNILSASSSTKKRDRLESYLPPLQEIIQPPRCSDHHRRPLPDIRELGPFWRPAIHTSRLQPGGLEKLLGFLVDLGGQLPGGRHDHNFDVPGISPGLQHTQSRRHHEAQGFPASRLGYAYQVVPFHNNGPSLGLDR